MHLVFTVRFLEVLLLNQISNICFDRADSGEPQNGLEMGVGWSGSVVLFIKVYCGKQFLTKLHASKQTHNPLKE